MPPSEGGYSQVEIQEHIRGCVAKNREERGRRPASSLFHFVRHAQAHHALRGMPLSEALDTIEQTIDATAEGGECPWRAAFGESRGTCMVEIEDLWDRITHLPGQDALASAFERAKRYPFELPPELAARRRSPDYRVFLAIAEQLQEDHPGVCILLPQGRLGELLALGQPAISRFCRWAKEDGYLKEIAAYARPVRGKGGKATEFVFDRWRGEGC